eukprot:TRINITY_DN6532_c0_g2_i4.p1 TRINITY_DN6532_c0_g2~~TRINITY_DN6532_c0_g2_i4.p1  ORF type:complete len:496 (-),score=118.00 TRINITY_DN6532_c0_g2_i4:86-1573(-)
MQTMFLLYLPFLVLLPTILLFRAITFVRKLRSRNPKELVVGFFHPYCNSGGGGERVLWKCIQTIQALAKRNPVRCVVYTGDPVPSNYILEKARKQFGITFDLPISFVFLQHRAWVGAERWPRFTLLGQSLGSVVLAVEALLKVTPDIFFDTTGYAFTYPLARVWFGCRVACYVHYPTISTDMLNKVQQRRPGYNNSDYVATSAVASTSKVIYYRAFAFLYGLVGKFASLVLVNSTWTLNHINSIWGVPSRTRIVYPPCPCQDLAALPIDSQRHPLIISVGQFRPEKDHELQLLSFANFVKGGGALGSTAVCSSSSSSGAGAGPLRWPQVKLALIGGCRDKEDEKRVNMLKSLAMKLDIENQVEFCVNVDHATLKAYMSRALVGVHTMWNEHFGISCVELMAAGVILVAHNSGGPKADIVKPSNQLPGIPTGYLAETPLQYAGCFEDIFSKYYSEEAGARQKLARLQEAARLQALQFSDAAFEASFGQAFKEFAKL